MKYFSLSRRYEPAKYQVDIALVISAADEKELTCNTLTLTGKIVEALFL